MTIAEVYERFRPGILHDVVGPGDVRQYVGYGDVIVGPKSSRSFTFALVGGRDPAEFTAARAAARTAAPLLF